MGREREEEGWGGRDRREGMEKRGRMDKLLKEGGEERSNSDCRKL